MRLSSGPGRASERVLAVLRKQIARAEPGAALPSVRDLCARLSASPVTVQRAITALVREGVVVTRPGHGTFVAEPAAAPAAGVDLGWQLLALGTRPPAGTALQALGAPPRPGLLTLASGYPDESLQALGALAAAMARAARRPGAWGRFPVEGHPELRAWFAREAGASVSPHDVLIVPGGQAALSTAFRALAPPGAPILFESPTYLGAIAAARAAGLSPVPVPTDARGVRPDLLAEAFSATGARVFYAQPTHSNPSGTTLAPERHDAVLAAAAAAGAFVVEDDFARDLTLEGEPPRTLLSADRDGRVVYIRSLTKAAAPSLRIAAVSARGPVAARLRTARVVDDLFVAGPLQETALELVGSPAWRRHLRALRETLRARRDVAVAALARYAPALKLPLVPRGGFHLWLELPPGVDDGALVAAALEDGVLATAGSAWFPAEPPGAFVRVSYASAEPRDLEAGIERIGEAARRLMSGAA